MTSSTYVKTNGQNVVEVYPYGIANLMYENPEVSFPVPIPDSTLAVYNVYPVEDTPQPDYDPMTQNLALIDPTRQSNVWIQRWSVTEATPAEQQERLDAWRASTSCTPLQGKIELDNQGLLDDAETIVAAADRVTKLAWANATIWYRTSPMIETIGTELSLSPTDLDNLFKAAQLIAV
jgi:hypothetical protein